MPAGRSWGQFMRVKYLRVQSKRIINIILPLLNHFKYFSFQFLNEKTIRNTVHNQKVVWRKTLFKSTVTHFWSDYESTTALRVSPKVKVKKFWRLIVNITATKNTRLILIWGLGLNWASTHHLCGLWVLCKLFRGLSCGSSEPNLYQKNVFELNITKLPKEWPRERTRERESKRANTHTKQRTREMEAKDMQRDTQW